jgi:hypothetical protein
MPREPERHRVQEPSPRNRSLGRAWILLCLALALHIFDEATTGFLGVYNPTVLALRERFGWWPMPTFEFTEWLAGLIVACVALLALSGAVARGAKGTRVAAYIFAIIMLINAASHTLATVFGRTVASVTFPRPAPGFWSSPIMAAAAIYLLVELRRSRQKHAVPS